jgi:FkbM family methyltransferase
MLNDRSLAFIGRNVVRTENWRALGRTFRVYPTPLHETWGYFTGRGSYPRPCAIRTPTGVVTPMLHSSHDLLTVNEVFCRLDYAAPDDIGAVVDIGANIGISALYFLTRNATSRCYLYEPVPLNVERLERNVADFRGRYILQRAAVWDRGGTVTFGVESTGRYCGIGVEAPQQIEVECLPVNQVLEDVLAREEFIDLLKIDTEGAELATVSAIRPDLLERIRLIYFEVAGRPAVHSGQFDAFYGCDTCRLVNRGTVGPRAVDAPPAR